MATNGCCPMKYVGICKTAFYFQEAGTGMDDVHVDVFDISTNTSVDRYLIQSNDRKFLFLNDDEQFKAAHQCQPACKFNVQFYKDMSRDAAQNGRALILYTNKDDKKMVVSCNERGEICAVEMNLPEHIPDGAHRAVFYRTETEISNDKYLLQSSLHTTKFLAFESDEEDHTLSKLVLREKETSQVDESCEVFMVRSN